MTALDRSPGAVTDPAAPGALICDFTNDKDLFRPVVIDYDSGTEATGRADEVRGSFLRASLTRMDVKLGHPARLQNARNGHRPKLAQNMPRL